jgi:hypothetical protein
VTLRAVLLEIQPGLLDELTVRWERPTEAGLRQGTAEAATLLREIERPEARVISAPTVLTRAGEAAEVSTSGEDGTVMFQMLPNLLAGGRLSLDVVLVASRPSSGAGDGKPRPSPRASRRRLAIEPERAAILTGSWEPASARRPGESHLALVVVAALEHRGARTAVADDAGRPAFDPEWTGEPMTLSLRGSSLRELVSTFEEQLGVRVEWQGDGGELPDRPVTLELRDVPWDYALAHVLGSSCMVTERQGATWTASPAPPGYQRLPGGSFVPCPWPKLVAAGPRPGRAVRNE